MNMTSQKVSKNTLKKKKIQGITSSDKNINFILNPFCLFQTYMVMQQNIKEYFEI
jgi:hypothetical protein